MISLPNATCCFRLGSECYVPLDAVRMELSAVQTSFASTPTGDEYRRLQLRISIGRKGARRLLDSLTNVSGNKFLWGRKWPRKFVSRTSVKQTLRTLGFNPRIVDAMYPLTREPTNFAWKTRILESSRVSLGLTGSGESRMILVANTSQPERAKRLDFVEIEQNLLERNAPHWRWALPGSTPLSMWPLYHVTSGKRHLTERRGWQEISDGCLKTSLKGLGFSASTVGSVVKEVSTF